MLHDLAGLFEPEDIDFLKPMGMAFVCQAYMLRTLTVHTAAEFLSTLSLRQLRTTLTAASLISLRSLHSYFPLKRFQPGSLGRVKARALPSDGLMMTLDRADGPRLR